MRAELGRATSKERMIYIFHLVGHCAAAEIARYSGQDEMDVRKVRTAVAFRLLMVSRT